MLGKSYDTVPRTSDSFYDDENDESASPAPPLISSIRIITSKPPVYRRQSESSNSLSPSSCCSDRDVTDVSSIGGEHHVVPEHQQQERRRHSHDQHPFHLQSMRHVLLGPSVPNSRPPSPANPPSQDIAKKHVRIVTDETENSHRQRTPHRHQTQQPYIHGHTKDYHRVRLTSSAINRQKQQQRIERENLKILERLQQTRASRGLKRDELLSHYDRQIGYVSYPTLPAGAPNTAGAAAAPARIRVPSRPSSAANMSSTFSTNEKKSMGQSRPSSASHLMNSNTGRSRPVSAPTSLHGSSRSSSARRPIWNDRWQQQHHHE